MIRRIFAPMIFALLTATLACAGVSAHEYKVLPPITKGNLSLFPIVGGPEANTTHASQIHFGMGGSITTPNVVVVFCLNNYC